MVTLKPIMRKEGGTNEILNTATERISKPDRNNNTNTNKEPDRLSSNQSPLRCESIKQAKMIINTQKRGTRMPYNGRTRTNEY